MVINYSRNEEGARAVAKDCEAFGVRTLVQQADVSDDTQCQTLVEATLAEFGRLDVLVNNAGTTKFCAHQDLDGLSKDDFLHLYAVNTVGPYQMTRAAEKALRQAGTAPSHAPTGSMPTEATGVSWEQSANSRQLPAIQARLKDVPLNRGVFFIESLRLIGS